MYPPPVGKIDGYKTEDLMVKDIGVWSIRRSSKI